jgi:hypothetical protein
MPNLRAYLANCLIGGHTFSSNGTSCIRDTVEFKCAGRTFILTQKESVITGNTSEFRGRFCETSEILVENVQTSEVNEILGAIDRICWLLSFAGLSSVVRYGHVYPEGGPCQQLRTVMGTTEYFRPTLEIRDGTLIKSFIEQTYTNFVSLEQSRKVNVVISYLLQAELPGQPTECKLIFAFVLLENLKHTYAASKNIPYLKGFFRKVPKPTNGGDRYSFVELLELMFNEVGMHPNLNDVKDLRNELIHSGLSTKPHNQLWVMYEGIHDLLREYILRLLGYTGYYLPYQHGAARSL